MSASTAALVGHLPLELLVEQFEAATLPLARFRHREHMRVALHYLSHETEAGATMRMRDGLKRLLAQQGVDGYHETLTVFWMKLLAARLARTNPARPLDARIDDVIAWCAVERPLARYYTAEVLASPEAKQRWVKPDLMPLG